MAEAIGILFEALANVVTGPRGMRVWVAVAAVLVAAAVSLLLALIAFTNVL